MNYFLMRFLSYFLVRIEQEEKKKREAKISGLPPSLQNSCSTDLCPSLVI